MSRQCIWCGCDQWAELADIYPEERSFLIGDSCCEAFGQQLYENYEFAVDFFKEQIMDYTSQKPRGLCFEGINMCLQIHPIKQAAAKAFIRQHHAHCGPPAGWKYGAGIWNWDTLIGVIMVGRPVARMIDHHSTVEVNRVCIDRDIAPELSWNACSQLYGWAAKEAKKRGFSKIITYTLDSEPGITMKAVGWEKEGSVKGRSWNTPSRKRTTITPLGNKTRWGKQLRKVA